ncbi:MAG: HIT domain-containing protein [Mycoplasmoidaceae bacterium]|nr:HIT domain-containing protein [Mycoplasmoidaceae bacterium]
MSCIFCDIVSKKIPAYVIAENDNALAFLDINPISDGHTVIISKKHYANLRECPEEVLSDMIKLTKIVTNKIDDSKLKP